MQIGGIGGVDTTAYQIGFVGTPYGDGMIGAGRQGTTVEGVGQAEKQVKAGFKSSPVECQSCKERKYVDGSDENVSFKSATHISPEAAMGRVMAHEGEHVANAYDKAAQGNGRVVNASVSIHTAVCPECGRTYVSGGTTRTTIKYNEGNPYGRNQKSLDGASLIGGKMDFSV